MSQLLKYLLLSFLFLSVFSNQSFADSLSDAERAYFTGDYEKAEKLIRPMADQGNASAQNTLGVMYLNGQGVSQD